MKYLLTLLSGLMLLTACNQEKREGTKDIDLLHNIHELPFAGDFFRNLRASIDNYIVKVQHNLENLMVASENRLKRNVFTHSEDVRVAIFSKVGVLMGSICIV